VPIMLGTYIALSCDNSNVFFDSSVVEAFKWLFKKGMMQEIMRKNI
jgi:hypothetical protein